MNAARMFRLPRGFLVAIEGIDGAGKTTQAAMLAGHLTAALSTEVVSSKEPTAGPWGAKIRASAATGRMSAEDELAAFLEDRKEHVAGFIEPALSRGALVILDRYYLSTATYQGARGLDVAEILRANEAFAPRPDLLVIIELDPEAAVARIGTRGGANAFEAIDNLRAVHEGFARLGAPYRIARIDGSQGPQEVHHVVREAVLQAYAERAREIIRGVENDDSIPVADKAAALARLLAV
jgi:dTMP kinase